MSRNVEPSVRPRTSITGSRESAAGDCRRFSSTTPPVMSSVIRSWS